MTWNIEERRTRRWVTGRGSRIDLRRALARSLRTGGEITDAADAAPAHPAAADRAAVRRQRLDGALHAHAAAVRAHAVARHARCRSVSVRDAADAHHDGAARRRSRMRRWPRCRGRSSDWSGGTRIGEALRSFHQRWRRRTLHGSSVVILISDGWDRGDPQLLRDEIARLQRSCHRLIWLNPLIGTVDYAPLTRGLQAALPFVDDFLPVRTLRDVRDLALHLGALNRPWTSPALTPSPRRPTRVWDADDGSRRDRVVHPGM